MQFVNVLRILLAATAPLTLAVPPPSAVELFGEAPPQRLEDASPMDNMIAEIQEDAQRASAYTGIERIDDAVIVAVRGAPRQQFVPERNRSLAYANHPLPIGHGQTISQPFIVALMTQLLDLEPHHRVLEIGTGSGYQAAVLARLAAEVYSIEIVPELAADASKRLARLGYDNVQVSAGDGWRGWPEQAPFDRVIVTAVGEQIPPALIEQLTADGRLVMPLGERHGYQELIVYSKRSGEIRSTLPVRFVPLTGGP